MSYSDQTTHFGWPLPNENDYFNGTDDNEMKEQLDEKIYNLEQAEASDTQSIADLTQRVTEAEQTIGEYDTRLENVEGAVAEHAERLINLTNRQTELSRRLNGKAGESTIAPEYNTEESYNVGDFVYHNNILYKAINASATPAGDWDADDWDIAILTDELRGSTPGAVAAADVTYSDVLTQLGANNVQAAIVALKTLIDNIGGSNMKTLTGTVTVPAASASSATVDISSLGLSSADDYFVILNAPLTAMPSGSPAIGGIGDVTLDDKTATSFKVNHGGSTLASDIVVTYQVVYNQ